VIEVIKPGLETSVQDYPGRLGYWNLGIPPSGPMDSLAFRLANLLVDNPAGTAGLEIQFVGPELKFGRDATIAITGAEMNPKINGVGVRNWRALRVERGDTLSFSPAEIGARAYLAVDGGIDTPAVMGSRSTFHRGGIGGVEGHALRAGQLVPLGKPLRSGADGILTQDKVPEYGRTWTIEVTAGPHVDWLDDEGVTLFLHTEWRVRAESDRTGYRLEGPSLTFSRKAHEKPPENGTDPTHIINTGYPIGGVNLCGRTPIVLGVDGPSQGGFINPFTVVSAALWKVGQARPGDILRFALVNMAEAVELRRRLDEWASEASLA
jgi:biotin-dependent carboxylase-like uncharacterized protein